MPEYWPPNKGQHSTTGNIFVRVANSPVMGCRAMVIMLGFQSYRMPYNNSIIIDWQ
jgi:hypothetical protein